MAIWPFWRLPYYLKLFNNFPCHLNYSITLNYSILKAICLEKITIQKDTCIAMFTAALFTKARTWKQPRCPFIEERIRKTWYIYTMEYNSAAVKPAGLRKAPLPSLITLETRASTYELGGGHKHSVWSRQRSCFQASSPSCPSPGSRLLRLCEGVRSHELQGEVLLRCYLKHGGIPSGSPSNLRL